MTKCVLSREILHGGLRYLPYIGNSEFSFANLKLPPDQPHHINKLDD